MNKLSVYFSVLVVSTTLTSCGDRTAAEASDFAADPIACSQDSDCCVVNDGCRATAYVVAAHSAERVSSIILQADSSPCVRCITPKVQARCVSGVCASERISFMCQLPKPYPGDHCGALDVPDECLSSSMNGDGGANLSLGGTSKPLGIFKCGG